MQEYYLRQELQIAKQYYSNANLPRALEHAQNAVEGYKQIYGSRETTLQTASELLDALTLLQSLLSLLHQPDAYLAQENLVQELIYYLFPDNGEELYTLHLFDACESMAINNYLLEARTFQIRAVSYLRETYGECPYTSFMQAYCDARIAFQIEDYYSCMDAAQLANSLWYTGEYGQAFPPFMERNAANEAAIDTIGYNNILLLCNTYGKINNPQPAINLLKEALSQNIFQGYQFLSAEITLAQLYAIARNYPAATAIYQKYATSGVLQYPDLAAALEGLAVQLQQKPVLPPATTFPNGYCYSHDALAVSRYNQALGLIAAGCHEKALAEFIALKEKGYSMTLALLAQLNRSDEITALKEQVNRFYYRRAEEIIRHYNEELAYNHLSQLQYHIDLCLDAYCYCCQNNPTGQNVADAYSFLLNTKYLALEVSHLQQTSMSQLHKQQNHATQLTDAIATRPLYCTEDIRAALPKNTLLLEFTLLRNLEQTMYGVFLLSTAEVHYIPLGKCKDIDALLNHWQEWLQTSVHATGRQADASQQELRSLDSKLRQILFLPLKQYLAQAQYKQLIIAPTGAMVNFPFSRLSVSARNYLGDTYSIRYINTGKELFLSKTTVGYSFASGYQETADGAPLIIGDPATIQYQPLPYAEAEADVAAYFLHGTAHKGHDASLNLFAPETFQPPSLLHIAAHGEFHAFSEQNESDWNRLYRAMTESGIVLADDRLLRLTQLGTLNFSNTQLAILSCCHSGQSTYRFTEGAFGLRRTLRLAGCKALIISLWQVDDVASYLWTQHFYEALTLSADTVSNAFDYAVNAVRNYTENGVQPFSHPYYWAGYILLQ